ncbi:MAG: Two-component system-response regulator, receiver domain protein, partial [Adhaeribacter sp.]|nr:Two-component system-response regulator, receiver domain protein [Adhaeribacter sp.]
DILLYILSSSNHPQDTSSASYYNSYYITKTLTIEKVETLLAMHYAGAE